MTRYLSSDCRRLSGFSLFCRGMMGLKVSQKQSRIDHVGQPRQQNPLGLVNLLRDYGVDEFGGLFLYLPVPKRARDRDVWAWPRLLEAQEIVDGRSWKLAGKLIAPQPPASVRGRAGAVRGLSAR